LQPLGSIFQHLLISDVNVLTLINNLGVICNIKMLKVVPKFFWALTHSVKLALMKFHYFVNNSV